MFNNQDQENQDPSLNEAPNSSPDPGNWEARAKGFQRALAGKEGYLNKLQAEHNALKAQLDSEAVTHQGEITQLRAQLDETLKKYQSVEAQLTSLQSENVGLKRDQEVRKFMAKDYSDLIPWYDAKYLEVGDLSGDDLKTHLEGFRNLLNDRSNTEVRNTLRGATPPVSVPAGKVDEMSSEDLADWLMDPANDSNPERAKYQELYYSQLG